MERAEKIIVSGVLGEKSTEYVSIASIQNKMAERYGELAIHAIARGDAIAARHFAHLAAQKARFHVPAGLVLGPPAWTCSTPTNGRHPTARMVYPGDSERERSRLEGETLKRNETF